MSFYRPFPYLHAKQKLIKTGTCSYSKTLATLDLLSICPYFLRSGYSPPTVNLTLESMFLLAFFSPNFNPSLHPSLSNMTIHTSNSLIFMKSRKDQLGTSFSICIFLLPPHMTHWPNTSLHLKTHSFSQRQGEWPFDSVFSSIFTKSSTFLAYLQNTIPVILSASAQLPQQADGALVIPGISLLHPQ